MADSMDIARNICMLFTLALMVVMAWMFWLFKVFWMIVPPRMGLPSCTTLLPEPFWMTLRALVVVDGAGDEA